MLAAIWDNKVDLIFFISLAFVILVFLIWILVNIIYTKHRNKNKIVNPTNNIENKEETEQEEQSEETKVEEPQEEVTPIVAAPVVEEQEETTIEDKVAEDTTEESNAPVAEEQEESAVEEVQTESQEEVVEEVKEETPEEVNDSQDAESAQEEQPEETKVEESQEEATPLVVAPVVEEQEEPTKEEEQEETPEEVKEEKKNTIKAVPVKKGRTYNGKYEVFQVADGYAYHLKASNGEILVSSETYASRDGVIKAIKAVQKNLETGEVRIFEDKRGKFNFKLISKNYRVLAISSNYSVEKSAVRASESFKKFAVTADIVDIELDDTEAKTATVIQITANEDKTGGKFVIEKFDGEYSWDLKASNGQILCQAEGYTSKVGCTNSIEAFKKCVENGVFKCVKDKTGRYCYKLYTQNNRICAVGESYSSKQGAESAANSVVSFYKLAIVEEIKK